MTRIAPVSLSPGQKVFWFDAGDLDIQETDQVVVETVHGKELGQMTDEVFEPTPEQMENFKNELKPVLRVATETDLRTHAENKEYAREALEGFKEIIEEEKKDMRAISVDFSLDRTKAVFCYEAEQRVDFREMVRTLARKFHTRVEMRQINARDRARGVGGFGACGQELCCARFGKPASHVTVRMAKEQGLSLNQQKISGCCGRLMCCLKYEFEEYKAFNKRAPKMNAKIKTPDGVARVCNLDMIHESVSLRVEPPAEDSAKGDSHETKRTKVVAVPLDAFDEPEGDAKRPNSVGLQAWEDAQKPPESDFKLSSYFDDSTKKFTHDSALGDAQAHRANTANRKNATGSVSMVEGSGGRAGGRGSRGAGGARGRGAGGARAGSSGSARGGGSRGSRFGGGSRGGFDAGSRGAKTKRDKRRTRSGAGGTGAQGTGPATGRVRRRRSVTVGADGSKITNDARSNAGSKTAVRPGQKSSNLRGGGSGAGTGGDAKTGGNTKKLNKNKRKRRTSRNKNNE